MMHLSNLLVPLIGATLVSAHGQVFQVEANGQSNAAPNIYYAADAKNGQTVTRTMYQASGKAFLSPSDFSDNYKMACEEAGPAPGVLSVSAGSTVTVHWSGSTSELQNQPGVGYTSDIPWVHGMGPVIDYIASCGDAGCASFDASNAGWTKLAEWGIDNSQAISQDLRNTLARKPEPYYPQGNGVWGLAKLIADGSKWDITVPAGLRNGQYIIRNELSALHNPRSGDPTSGPQLYVACVQIEVTNGGDTSLPAGTQAGSLYNPNGDFANFNVYSSPNAAQSFSVPGPSVWDQVTSGGGQSSAPAPSGGDSGSNNGQSGADNSNNSGNTDNTNYGEAAPAPEPTTSSNASEPAPTKSCRKRRSLNHKRQAHRHALRNSVKRLHGDSL